MDCRPVNGFARDFGRAASVAAAKLLARFGGFEIAIPELAVFALEYCHAFLERFAHQFFFLTHLCTATQLLVERVFRS